MDEHIARYRHMAVHCRLLAQQASSEDAALLLELAQDFEEHVAELEADEEGHLGQDRPASTSVPFSVRSFQRQP